MEPDAYPYEMDALGSTDSSQSSAEADGAVGPQLAVENESVPQGNRTAQGLKIYYDAGVEAEIE